MDFWFWFSGFFSLSLLSPSPRRWYAWNAARAGDSYTHLFLLLHGTMVVGVAQDGEGRVWNSPIKKQTNIKHLSVMVCNAIVDGTVMSLNTEYNKRTSSLVLFNKCLHVCQIG